MATPLPSGAIWLYTIRSTMNQQIFLNTLLVTRKVATSESDYLATAAAFTNAQYSAAGQTLRSYKDCCSSDLTFVSLSMQPIYPMRYQAYTLFLNAQFGTIASPSLPMNSGATITKKTINATRWGIGSIHLVGQPANQQAQGVWSSAFLTTLNYFATCLASDLTPGDASAPWRVVLWNRAVPARVSMLNGAIAQDTTRTERRRTVRVGI